MLKKSGIRNWIWRSRALQSHSASLLPPSLISMSPRWFGGIAKDRAYARDCCFSVLVVSFTQGGFPDSMAKIAVRNGRFGGDVLFSRIWHQLAGRSEDTVYSRDWRFPVLVASFTQSGSLYHMAKIDVMTGRCGDSLPYSRTPRPFSPYRRFAIDLERNRYLWRMRATGVSPVLVVSFTNGGFLYP